jgi:hypothetical protein
MGNPALAIAKPEERWMRWSVLGLLTVAIIIAYVDRINLSSALPEMRKLPPDAASFGDPALGILLVVRRLANTRRVDY